MATRVTGLPALGHRLNGLRPEARGSPRRGLALCTHASSPIFLPARDNDPTVSAASARS